MRTRGRHAPRFWPWPWRWALLRRWRPMTGQRSTRARQARSCHASPFPTAIRGFFRKTGSPAQGQRAVWVDRAWIPPELYVDPYTGE